MDMNRFNWSVEVDSHAIHQPSPRFHSYGDCGACCLAGAVGWTAERLPELYEGSLQPFHGGSTRTYKDSPLNWQDLIGKGGPWLHNKLRLIEPVVIDPVGPDMSRWQQDLHNPWATAPWSLIDPWFHRLRLYLQSGYVGMTTITFEGDGPYEKRSDGSMFNRGTNHWVLLNGAKAIREQRGDGGFTQVEMVRVSCSVKGDYWANAREFLTLYGGYWLAFIRRVPLVAVNAWVDTGRRC